MLAHGRNRDDRDRQIEISGQPSHDLELLVVLFAEHREIGRALDQQLADHGCDAGEEMRAKPVFQPGRGGPFGDDSGRKSCRVHHLRGRRPDQIDRKIGERREVGGEAARIAAKVLVGRKLRGVDEDRDHNPPGAAPCRPHQREMAGMQRTHGRHQRDPLAGHSPLHDGAAQCRHRAHDSMGHEDGLRLIEDRKRRAQASKAVVWRPRAADDPALCSGHAPAGIAPAARYGHLKGRRACRQLKRVSHGP